jgi:Ca-activated chloride channel family protein
MHQTTVLCGTLIFSLLGRVDAQTGGTPPQDRPTYRLRVSVDEVVITFHAAKADGLPINDLKLSELRLLDNGTPPARIIDFQMLQDLPIRAGILLDTSDSMQGYSSKNRTIANQYAQEVLRRHTDQAFVMDFGRVSNVLQSLTSDPVVVTAAVRKVPPSGPSGIRGTAVFDAIFRACLYEFGSGDHAASGNFILLFSDGVDNASNVSLKDAVDMCQRTNTAIYAFRPEAQGAGGSSGPATLAELAAQTGGRVFPGRDSEDEVAASLRAIEANLRNQYRLVYKPAALTRDGSFHNIVLEGPERVDGITIRSGYYAPTQ